MTHKEIIEYTEQLLLDDTLTGEIKLGLEEALKKLKKDRTRDNINLAIEIIKILLGIGSGFS